jgi:hypothetical protein
MNRIVRIAMRLSPACLIVGVMVTAAPAYDLLTHEELSRAAFEQSGISATLESLYGLDATDRFRGPLPLSLFSEARTPENWIVQGARDEDFLLRPLNHFWNPLTDAPLTVEGFPPGNRAPDWALEDRNGFTSQRYSYRDAREAFATALTASDPTARERAWAHTFYTLGHVIHLLQDMAQPQHTRNDRHFHLGSSRSLMERYVEDGVQQGRFVLTGAAVPTATRPRDLWARVLEEGLPQGMASFSNANFLSAGTNFKELRAGTTAQGFPSPALNLADRRPSTSADRCKDGTAPPDGNSVPLIFYGNALTDPVTGSPLHNPRMTTHSLFDQYLQARGRELTFTLNCFNLDTAADILLPRAASYSAALLQYFFRGVLNASIENLNLRIFAYPETMVGTFELRYERTDGSRPALASWALHIEPEQESPPLSTPQLPADAAPGAPCWLIFRGQLGAEPDAVVGTRVGCPFTPPPPPTPGQWYVYLCATFLSELDYLYATTNPPLWEGPNDPALVFGYRQESTGTGFSCSLLVRQAQQPPPNARTEHPA